MSEGSKKSISIVGCGWLGLPFAKQLLSRSWKVTGTTTSSAKIEALRKEGIRAYQLVLKSDPEQLVLPEILDSDIVLLNIPPRRVDGIESIYPSQIESVLKSIIPGKSKIMFISSTSVYPDLNGEVQEGQEGGASLKRSGAALLEAEKRIIDYFPEHSTIIRFAGLMGPKRHPGRFLAGKSGLSGPQNPVNLIHLQDCLQIMELIIEIGCWGETLNGCAPVHPSRMDFYTKAAIDLGLEAPTFDNKESPFKSISSKKLISCLGYEYSFPNPMMALSYC